MNRHRTETLSRDEGEEIAVAALAYLAEDAELTGRFLALSGLEVGGLRQAAGEPGFLAGVLDFVVANEPVLMALAERTGRRLAEIEAAQRMLSDDRVGREAD